MTRPTHHARSASILTIALSLASALGTNSCIGDVDYYSQVAPLCQQEIPDLGSYFSNPAYQTYIDPACKAALLEILPIDDASFENAPPGYLDKILEALQAILAYPLKLPETNAIFGMAPAKAGAIPYDFYRIYRESGWDNPNQALFNYMVSRFKIIRYQEGGPESSSATCTLTAKGLCTLTVYKKLWDIERDPLDRMRNPFIRASILAHEARHGDGYTHSHCKLGTSDNEGFECDHELAGPIGFGIVYLKFLLQGSATCETRNLLTGCEAPLTPRIISTVAMDMCFDLKEKILDLYPELDRFLEEKDCTYVDYDWVMEAENIPYPVEGMRPENPPTEIGPEPEPSPSPILVE